MYVRKFDPEPLIYDGNAEQIVGWLKKNSYPRFSEAVWQYSDAYTKYGVPALWLISNIKSRDTSYHKAFKQASEEID